jgi:hypothetical protein
MCASACGRIAFDVGPCDNGFCSQNELGGDGAPVNSGLTGPLLLFQPDYQSGQPNAGQPGVEQGGVSQSYTVAIYADPSDGRTKMLVNDRLNHRVLIFNSVPRESQALPDVVVGQTDFTSGLINAGQAGPNAIGFSDNTEASVCGTGELFVTDSTNNRIMVWRQVPTSNGAPADFVIGQPDFSSNASGAGMTGFLDPHDARCVDRRLVIADRDNHRLVIYDGIPSSGSDLPTRVVGQPDFNSVALGCTATAMNNPYQLLTHNGLVYVADGSNNRILVYDDTFWTATNPPAIAVLGQVDFTHCLKNQGATTPDATTLSSPNSLTARNDVLVVTDHDNHRVVFYRLPAKSGDAGIALLGHTTWTDATLVAPPTADTLNNPKGLVFDGDFIWIGDNRNNRVLAAALPAL